MKFNISRLNGKITLATLKALIAAGDAPEATIDTVQLMAGTKLADVRGLRIQFGRDPSKCIVAALKANGWQWARHTRFWWIKDSPSARGFASLFGSVA